MLKPVIGDPALDADSYIVETILAHRGLSSKRQFLVRWKGLGPDRDSWESEEALANSPDVDDFWSRKKAEENDALPSDSHPRDPPPTSILAGSDVVTQSLAALLSRTSP